MYKGKNSLKSQEMFEERKIYKEEVEFTGQIDFWYDKTRYGRRDLQNELIMPKQDRLVIVGQSNTGKPIKVLDFVAEAYKDLTTKFTRATVVPPFNKKKSIYDNLTIKRGYIDAEEGFNYHYYSLYTFFTSTYLDAKKQKKIKSFPSFVKEFTRFILENAGTMPFSFSGISDSMFHSVMMSGLAFEVASEDHGDDAIKEKYLNDPKFLQSNILLSETLERGFMIDKNAPWRFVANLNSEKMQSHYHATMGKVGEKTTATIFDTHFVHLALKELELLKAIIFALYETYISENPTTSTQIFSQACQTTRNAIIVRRKLYEYDMDAYPTEFWIAFYLKIRAKEKHIVLSKQHFNKILGDAIFIYKYVDKNKFNSNYPEQSIRFLNKSLELLQ